jgi:hypothetical protein
MQSQAPTILALLDDKSLTAPRTHGRSLLHRYLGYPHASRSRRALVALTCRVYLERHGLRSVKPAERLRLGEGSLPGLCQEDQFLGAGIGPRGTRPLRGCGLRRSRALCLKRSNRGASAVAKLARAAGKGSSMRTVSVSRIVRRTLPSTFIAH